MMMHILCSTDANYIMPTGVMIRSASVNNMESNICFHIIIDNSVTKTHKTQLSNVVSDNKKHRVEFYTIDSEICQQFPSLGSVKEYITKATYYRLFVTEILPDSIDKVIYLDGDIIVDKPIIQLWDFSINDYGVGVVTDMSESLHDFERLGYSNALGYFNAGVLLINLKYWRDNQIINEFSNIIRNHSDRIVQHDQDVLNIVFANRKVMLPFKFNCQNGFLFTKDRLELDYEKYREELDDVKKNHVIVHYTAMIKPWHKECNHPWKDLWYNYLSQTEWAHYKPKRKYPVSMTGNILRYFKLLPPLCPISNPYV